MRSELFSRAMVGLGVAATLALTTLASADGPAVTLNINGGSSTLSGTATAAANIYNYSGSLSDAGGLWSFGYDFNASNMADFQTSFVSGNFVLINAGSTARDFSITLTLPVMVSGAKNTLYGGSVAGSMIADADGGTFSTLGTTPVWAASTNGASIANLLNAPVSVTASPFQAASIGSASFGEPIPSASGPNLSTNLAITFTFRLGAGDSAAFTSVLVAQVPAPGAVALLGVAGLVARRRRRD